jgi:hypothetical protein
MWIRTWRGLHHHPLTLLYNYGLDEQEMEKRRGSRSGLYRGVYIVFSRFVRNRTSIVTNPNSSFPLLVMEEQVSMALFWLSPISRFQLSA